MRPPAWFGQNVGVRKVSARTDEDGESKSGTANFAAIRSLTTILSPDLSILTRPLLADISVDSPVDFSNSRTQQNKHIQHGYVSGFKTGRREGRCSINGLCCSEGSLQDLQENEIESNWDQIVDK